MFFERIFKQLNHSRIQYLVIGGVAVNLYGFPRATGDLDIMISLKDANVKKFITLMRRLGWRPRIPVPMEALADPAQRKTWIKDKGMKVFSIYDPKKDFECIDVMIQNDLDFSRAYRDRKMVPSGKIKLPLVSISDLIRLKKIAGRQRDLLDIQALNEVRRLRHASKKRS